MARPKEFDQNRVLGKAMDVFWCRGYEATSVQDLVDQLGINRQSIYDTFGDKHALFLAALKHYEEVKVSEISAILAKPGPVKAAIRQVFEETVQDLAYSEPKRGCMMVNTIVELAPHDAQIAARVMANQQQTEAALHDALLRAQAQGEFGERNLDLQALARFLYNNLQGLAVTAKATSNPAVLQDIVKITLSVLD